MMAVRTPKVKKNVEQQIDHEVLKRQQRVADYYSRGVRQIDIAERLDVSQMTISNDIKAIQKLWRESMIRDFDDAKAIEMNKIDAVERAAWEAWEKSCEPRKRVTYRKNRFGKERDQWVENQAGDNRFLAMVLACVTKRCQLLGLDAPVKVQMQHSFDDEETLAITEKRLGIMPSRWKLPSTSSN